MKNVSDIREIYLDNITNLTLSNSLKIGMPNYDVDKKFRNKSSENINSKILLDKSNEKPPFELKAEEADIRNSSIYGSPLNEIATKKEEYIPEKTICEENNSNESSFEDCNENIGKKDVYYNFYKCIG